MDLQERNESIGGSGYACGYNGGYGLILLAIFLVVLFAMWGRNGHGAGDAAALANTMGEFHPRENCADKLTWARYANYVDPRISDIEKQNARDTGEIKCGILTQTHELTLGQERNTWAIITNQNTIARDQERAFYAAREADANRREAEQRERAIMLEGKLLAAEQAREADRRQQELLTTINGQFCLVNNRVTAIEGNMLKAAPCYVPTNPVSLQVCGPAPTPMYSPCRGNG